MSKGIKSVTPYHHYFNTIIIVLLIVFSVGSIVAHRLGAFDISLMLSNPGYLSGYGELAEGVAESEFSLSDSQFSTRCELVDTQVYAFCGLTLALGEGGLPDKGKNLSKYDRLELKVRYQSPMPDAKVRLHFRNFHPSYSRVDDYVTLKFNSIAFEPEGASSLLEIPLNAFQVEDWWIDQNHIQFEDAHLDFSNVSYVELVTDRMTIPGTYVVVLESATLTGEFISEQDLLKLLLFILLFVIILLVVRQSRNLRVISTTDTLTGLMNRRGLNNWVNKRISHYLSFQPVVMYYFDIDDFKKVNDTFGHIVGDELLVRFCERMREIAKPFRRKASDFAFGRLAGDEFALVFKGLETSHVKPFARKVIEDLSKPLLLSSYEIKITVSLGAVVSDAKTKNFENLMSLADSAMYYAKKRGKNQFKLFDENVSKEIYFRKKVAEKLQKALLDNTFHLNFMPIFDCLSNEIVRAEVLIRTHSSELKGVGPDVFIPIAEEFGIVRDLDLWVIESTFQHISEHRALFEAKPLIFCINISAIELQNTLFTKGLRKLLKKYHIPPEWIELEITETSLIEADERSIGVLSDLRNMGVMLALDDFGTGYTAFNQLVNYPVDCLKIDRSFVCDLDANDETKTTMVKAIISIAKSYRLKTIAEGIETQEQLQYLASHKCDMAQGYLLSKPLSWELFLENYLDKKQVEAIEFEPKYSH